MIIFKIHTNQPLSEYSQLLSSHFFLVARKRTGTGHKSAIRQFAWRVGCLLVAHAAITAGCAWVCDVLTRIRARCHGTWLKDRENREMTRFFSPVYSSLCHYRGCLGLFLFREVEWWTPESRKYLIALKRLMRHHS